MKHLSRRTGVAVVGLWLALGAAGCEERPAVPSPPPQGPPRATTPVETTALGQALDARLGPPPGGYRASRDRKGRLLVDHGGRFQSMTVVGRAPDGSLRVGCVSSAAEAEAVVSGRVQIGRAHV